MKYDTLLAWHMEHDLPVETYGTGHSYVVVPDGEDLGGQIGAVLSCAICREWGVITDMRRHVRLIPTYAYDRVVIAGLRCAAEVTCGPQM